MPTTMTAMMMAAAMTAINAAKKADEILALWYFGPYASLLFLFMTLYSFVKLHLYIYDVLRIRDCLEFETNAVFPVVDLVPCFLHSGIPFLKPLNAIFSSCSGIFC